MLSPSAAPAVTPSSAAGPLPTRPEYAPTRPVLRPDHRRAVAR
ncbi:hypothetical protein [Kitasatospora phosalacinea]|uniref:Uncharacterized protein n=1 Tax=Kitasatospora phosalacinea TaxID=2065 RepID=A0ABW6GLF2_9ACTN